jgi:adhesin HecA-like repeat protein
MSQTIVITNNSKKFKIDLTRENIMSYRINSNDIANTGDNFVNIKFFLNTDYVYSSIDNILVTVSSYLNDDIVRNEHFIFKLEDLFFDKLINLNTDYITIFIDNTGLSLTGLTPVFAELHGNITQIKIPLVSRIYGSSNVPIKTDIEGRLDISGQTIQVQGGIDISGQRVDISGQSVQVQGGIDISGQRVDISGQTVIVQGGIDISGQRVDISGQTVQVQGGIDISGQRVDISGQTVIVQGGIDISGQRVDISGQRLLVYDSILETSVNNVYANISYGNTKLNIIQLVTEDNNTILHNFNFDTSGNLKTDISGQKVDISGQKVDISGQSVLINGTINVNIKDSSGNAITSTITAISNSQDVYINNEDTTNTIVSGYNSSGNGEVIYPSSGINFYQIMPKIRSFAMCGANGSPTSVADTLLCGSGNTLSIITTSFGFVNKKTFYGFIPTGSTTRSIAYTYIDNSGNEATGSNTITPVNTYVPLFTGVGINQFNVSGNVNIGTSDNIYITISNTIGNTLHVGYLGNVRIYNCGVFTCPNNAIAMVTSVDCNIGTANDLFYMHIWDRNGNRTIPIAYYMYLSGVNNAKVAGSGEYGCIGRILTAGETVGFSSWNSSTTNKTIYYNVLVKYF